jgi:apolipoprotein N-acyltransferase
MAGLSPRKQLLLALISGVVAALGQAPIGAWPLTILALALIYGMFQTAQGWRRAAFLGWIFGVGYFALALSWMIEPFLVDAARYGWMVPFIIVLVSTGFALFWGLGFGVAKAMGSRAIGWIAALVLTEALRGWVFTGFPWAQIGHVLIDTPLLQWVMFTGALGLSALVLAAGAALWAALDMRDIRALLVLAALTLLYATGNYINPPPLVPADAPIVRLVQPNAPQREKWDPAKRGKFFDRQVEFTAAGARPDLIVWPEAAIPVLLRDAQPAFDAIAQAARGASVALGVIRYDGKRLFNSMVLLDPTGQVADVYDKRHLVPFGEYMPLEGLMQRIGISGMASRGGIGYSAGVVGQMMAIDGVGMALPLICYESIFSRDIRAVPGRADFMMLITNDAWFGEVSGPYQHLAQARLRSVEQGLPMIRVANTGISAMINTSGQITAQIPLGQAGWKDVALPPPLPPTIYARFGDLPLLLLMLLMLGLSQLSGSARKTR